MSEDIESRGEDWERDLRRALAELPGERAPRSLQRKLERIPRRGRWISWPVRWRPALALGLLLVPLTLVVVMQQQRLAEQEQALARQAQQVAQARRELALALSYVEKANEIASRQIAEALENGLTRPVRDNTMYGLQKPLEITREYQL